jgi:hypothetical protein
MYQRAAGIGPANGVRDDGDANTEDADRAVQNITRKQPELL